MLLRDLTSDDAKTVCAHLQQRYNFTIHDKRTSDAMGIVGDILEALGIVPKQDFVNGFCTTILNSVFLNFTVGDDSMPFVDQIAIVVHEATHVVQSRSNAFTFAGMYLASSTERAHLEAEAYAAASTIMFVCTGLVWDEEDVRQVLGESYGCGKQQADMAYAMLHTSNDVIRRGGHVGEVAQEAIRVMREMGLLA